MSYYSGYARYVSAAEKKAKAEKSLAKLRKKNPGIAPVVINGTKIAKTWWGIAWNENLERYADYENRIDRGKSYVRQAAVLDLKIAPGSVSALVQGSTRKPYEVTINIDPLGKKIWESIAKECEGKIDSLQELLEGKFPKALRELFTAQGKGLFPSPKEISFGCSCPDWASMCKHVAAVLYGIGARLDENPSLFFTLRDVNVDKLITTAIVKKSESLIKKSAGRSKRIIREDDISGMFGIDIKPSEQPPKKRKKKTGE